MSPSSGWRLTGSMKLYIVAAQLDGGVTGRDHKSDQAREGQHMPGIMSNQACFRQGTHPLLQLSHMLYLQSTINDLISSGPQSFSVSVRVHEGIFTLTSLQCVCVFYTYVCVCVSSWYSRRSQTHFNTDADLKVVMCFVVIVTRHDGCIFSWQRRCC